MRGPVNPNGLPTTYRFEYGRTTAYGRRTRLRTAGADFAAQLVSVKVRKLKPGKRYHFRVVATNATGTAAGADRTFRTKRKRKRHRHH